MLSRLAHLQPLFAHGTTRAMPSNQSPRDRTYGSTEASPSVLDSRNKILTRNPTTTQLGCIAWQVVQ